MTALKFNFLCLAALLTISNATDMCTFKYSVPKSRGNSCDFMGGVNEDTEKNVMELIGNMEGLRHIQETNSALLVSFYETMDGRNEQKASTEVQIDSIGQDLVNLKGIVKRVFDGNNQKSFNQQNRADTRVAANGAAVPSPLRALEDAIHEAEIKLDNISQILQEAARQNSILKSSLESRVIQQQVQRQQLMARIQALTNKLSNFTTPRPILATTSPQASTAPNNNNNSNNSALLSEYEKLYKLSINVSAELFAKKAIVNRDLNNMASTFNQLKPKTAVVQNDLISLYNDTVQVVSDLTSVENTISSIETEINLTKTDWGKRFVGFLQALSNFSSDKARIENTYYEHDKNISNLRAGEMSEGIMITQIQTTLNNLEKQLNNTIIQMNQYETKIHIMENSPLVTLVEAKQTAVNELQKDQLLIHQLQGFVHGLNSTIASKLKPTLASG